MRASQLNKKVIEKGHREREYQLWYFLFSFERLKQALNALF
jgi:hypothetical protein